MTDIARDIVRLAEEYGLADVYVFGSRALELASRVRGEAGIASTDSRASDVDIGVRPLRGTDLDVRQRVRLAGGLESLLRADRVDLIVLPEADPFLALDVIRGELLYCRDAADQAEHELFVLRRAGDLAPHQRARQELILARYQKP